MDGEKIIIPGSGKASDPDVEVNLDTIQAGEPEKPQISPEAAKTPQPENGKRHIILLFGIAIVIISGVYSRGRAHSD